jgi:Hsp70 protein
MAGEARYSVGIDLGTTNCAVAYADLISDETASAETGAIRDLAVPQLVNAGEVAERSLLPSFLYVTGEFDFPADSLRLPWKDDAAERWVVGELARKRGAENPSRLVASAKSWLSYAGASRTSPILPWAAPDEVRKLSPVDASARYLQYLKHVWNCRFAEASGLSLDREDVLITVPASFDEEARELTLRAASEAGFGNVTLLEEPQAACYAWIDSMGEAWRRTLRVGDLLLVVDIGGGTTDFSLISVAEHDGDLALERVAIGDHILLGGDNMDLALARLMQQRLEGEGHRIDTWQLQNLWHQCRLAKETLLAHADQDVHPITVLGKGSRLIGGTVRGELRRDDLNKALVDGFFPQVAANEMPVRRTAMGLQELGLPYAADPAVTRHLARFLSRQAAGAHGSSSLVRRGPGGLVCPTHLLFNGGVMKAEPLRARIVDVLNSWLTRDGFAPLDAAHVLDAQDLDHAVARGAAYYGRVRASGRGVRIRSGASRSYYIGIESALPAVPGFAAPLKALCVVPFGMEEGTSASMAGREFGLAVGEPAEFRFLTSTIRKGDQPGTIIEDWGDDLDELGRLEVTLEHDPGTTSAASQRVIPVTLESRFSEIGTLELWCETRDRSHRWKLELNIREARPAHEQ